MCLCVNKRKALNGNHWFRSFIITIQKNRRNDPKKRLLWTLIISAHYPSQGMPIGRAKRRSKAFRQLLSEHSSRLMPIHIAREQRQSHIHSLIQRTTTLFMLLNTDARARTHTHSCGFFENSQKCPSTLSVELAAIDMRRLRLIALMSSESCFSTMWCAKFWKFHPPIREIRIT